MENREATIGQAVQCKKTDWFKKIYGDMISDEESRSITLPDGTRIEINPMQFDTYLSDSRNATRTDAYSARVTAMEDAMIERILNSDNSDEVTAEAANNF